MGQLAGVDMDVMGHSFKFELEEGANISGRPGNQFTPQLGNAFQMVS